MQRSGHNTAMTSRCARAPVKAGDGGFLNFECIHESDDVEADGRLLGVAHGRAGKKAGGAVAAQIGDDDVGSLRLQAPVWRRQAVDVVGPAMEKNDCRTIGGASFGVSNIKQTGVDLLEGLKDVFVPGLIAATFDAASPVWAVADAIAPSRQPPSSWRWSQ